MVTSNIHRDTDGIFQKDSRFYKVADNFEIYAGLAESTFSINADYDGHDHFTHTMRSIDNLWNVYSRNSNIDTAFSEINKNISLKRWFAAVICMIIYGASNGYRLRITNYSVEGRSFLNVWKNKFIKNNTNDNLIPPYNIENDISDGMLVYEFVKNEQVSIIGCCSNKYCVIPARQIITKGNGWEELFNELVCTDDLQKYITTELPAEYLIKLKFSAFSLPKDVPVQIIKDIINSAVNPNIEFSDDVPYKSVGYLKIYCTEGNDISNKVFCNEIYLTNIEDKYVSLYPLRMNFADNLEKKITSVRNLKMEISHIEYSNDKRGYNDRLGNFVESVGKVRSNDTTKANISKVSVSGDFCYRVSFQSLDDESRTVVLPYYFTDKKEYVGDSIKSADSIGTFCTYPDIPLEYEYRCGLYTYFYDLNSCLFGKGQAANLELSDVDFKKAYNNDNLYLYSSDKPIHVFKVSLSKTKYSSQNRYAGCIINVRKLGNSECTSPLLTVGESVDIDLNVNILNPDYTMNIYIDFGSSSSAIGYKIGNSSFTVDDITGGTQIVRELLGKYDTKRYSYFMNLPSLYKKRGTVPSAVIEFCEEQFGGFPHDNAFLPFHRHFSKFENNNLKICDIDKSKLTVRGENMPEALIAVIENLCYVSLCHAISCNCAEVVFVQSFPNEAYKEHYLNIVNSFCDDVKKRVFPDLIINNVIDCDSSYLLYESLAISNGISEIPENILMVSVDIGDSTTDFAAVYCNDNKKTVCGYSSIDYAGKQLLKRSVRDMLLHSGDRNIPGDVTEKITDFMLGTDEIPAFFKSKTGKDESLKKLVLTLCKRFEMDVDNNGHLKSSAWENIFLEILECADINPEACSGKIKADLILRYILLMPVIKDFVETSLNACQNPKGAAVNLTFYGGGSKGILLVDSIMGNFISSIETYLKDVCVNVNADVALNDSKKQLLTGLEHLDVIRKNNGTYDVMLKGTEETEANWKYVNPKYADSFISDTRQAKCAEFNIKPLSSAENNIIYNIEQRRKASNFIKDNVYDGMRKYIAGIIDFFMSDEKEKILFKNTFADDAAWNIKNKISHQLISNKSSELSSFMKASEAEIYPEMIRNTAYLFETSRIMSDCFGIGFDGRRITDESIDDYKYSGGKQSN